MRYTRDSRLLQSVEFRRVFQQSRKSSDACLTVLGRRNRLEFPRLGLAISKKSISTAVGRNRIKRLIRESFRAHQHHLGPIDIVVLAKRSAGLASNRKISESLEKHWQRLGAG